MVKEALARRARFERSQREALMRQRAEAAVRKAFLMNQQKAAMAIQVWFLFLRPKGSFSFFVHSIVCDTSGIMRAY